MFVYPALVALLLELFHAEEGILSAGATRVLVARQMGLAPFRLSAGSEN
jgi:hypothetical protein